MVFHVPLTSLVDFIASSIIQIDLYKNMFSKYSKTDSIQRQ